MREDEVKPYNKDTEKAMLTGIATLLLILILFMIVNRLVEIDKAKKGEGFIPQCSCCRNE